MLRDRVPAATVPMDRSSPVFISTRYMETLAEPSLAAYTKRPLISVAR